MHAARLFHMLLPASLGGGAADLVTFNQVIETVAAADASTGLVPGAGGWRARMRRASSIREIAREVFGAPDALVAWGPPAGLAKAIAVEGGYRVTGKWRFASGSANATWMGGHSTVFEADGKPRLDANGQADQPHRAVPAERGAPSTTPGMSSGCAAPPATTTRSPTCSCARTTPPGATGRRTGARRAALQHPAADALRHRLFRRGARHRARLPRRVHDAGADQEIERRRRLDRRCCATTR